MQSHQWKEINFEETQIVWYGTVVNKESHDLPSSFQILSCNQWKYVH